MKIVVFGPGRRTGALRDGMVVDLCGAFAKYAAEKMAEAHPVALAQTLVPADLARFIEGGARTRNVRTGKTYGDQVEVLSGLLEGEKVVLGEARQ